MSVNWDWNDKFGEVDMTISLGDVKRSFVVDLYHANCLFCMIYNYPDGKRYTFRNFFSDVEHLKRCVGLLRDNEGNFTNIFKGEETWTEIRLSTLDRSDKTRFKRVLKVGQVLAEAGFRVVFDNFNYHVGENNE